jgi:hypothetical protein
MPLTVAQRDDGGVGEMRPAGDDNDEKAVADGSRT